MSKIFSFIDFIADIASACFNSNGTTGTPYDINFTKHYEKLYDFCKDNKISAVDKVTQDKKTKQLDVKFDNIDKGIDKIKNYCQENDIEYNIRNNTLRSIKINKNTKGVMEERQWKIPLEK